jgi:hypothetical protein
MSTKCGIMIFVLFVLVVGGSPWARRSNMFG